jgi:hypothetical protein
MSYYIGLSGPTATVTLLGPKGQVVQKLNGTLRSSQPLHLKVQRPEFPVGYPSYEVITIEDITEVVEHRAMEPVFYMSDDPNVLADLGVKK